MINSHETIQGFMKKSQEIKQGLTNYNCDRNAHMVTIHKERTLACQLVIADNGVDDVSAHGAAKALQIFKDGIKNRLENPAAGVQPLFVLAEQSALTSFVARESSVGKFKMLFAAGAQDDRDKADKKETATLATNEEMKLMLLSPPSSGYLQLCTLDELLQNIEATISACKEKDELAEKVKQFKVSKGVLSELLGVTRGYAKE
eukprot:3235752-Amphidinium_carterae.1